MSDVETLEIKKRARRRLVGAIALALFAAIVLPLMMEREPHPGSSDIQLSLPRALSETPPPPLSAAPADDEGSDDEAPPVAVATPPPPALTPPPAATAKPAALPKTPLADKAVAEPAPPVALAPGSFVLQIGAFSDAAKAAALVGRLKEKGFPAYTERAGKMTRVRVGPLQGRAAADKTAAELALHGYSSVSSPL